jgi:hypothetical protein
MGLGVIIRCLRSSAAGGGRSPRPVDSVDLKSEQREPNMGLCEGRRRPAENYCKLKRSQYFASDTEERMGSLAIRFSSSCREII